MSSTKEGNPPIDMNVTNPKTKDAHAPLACKIKSKTRNDKPSIPSGSTDQNRGIRSYQYRVIARPDVQVDRPDADGDHNVNHEPEPVIPEVPRHVDEGTLRQDRGLHQEARLAPARVENRPFLQSIVCQMTQITDPIDEASCQRTYDFRYLVDFLSCGVVVLRSSVEVDQSSGCLGRTHLLERIVGCCKLKGRKQPGVSLSLVYKFWNQIGRNGRRFEEIPGVSSTL